MLSCSLNGAVTPISKIPEHVRCARNNGECTMSCTPRRLRKSSATKASCRTVTMCSPALPVSDGNDHIIVQMKNNADEEFEFKPWRRTQNSSSCEVKILNHWLDR